MIEFSVVVREFGFGNVVLVVALFFGKLFCQMFIGMEGLEQYREQYRRH